MEPPLSGSVTGSAIFHEPFRFLSNILSRHPCPANKKQGKNFTLLR